MTVSRIDAELWALGELDAARAAEIERLREADDELRAWTDGIKARIVEAEADLPMLQLPAEEPGFDWRALFAPRGLALVGAAALIALGVGLALQEPETTEVFRGAIDLEVHRVRDGTASAQSTLIQVREGDRLQLRITTPRAGSLSIFDLQDDGELTEWMAPRPVSGLQPVDFAVVLDDYPGSERVFVVFGEEPVGRADVQAALQNTFDRPLADLDTIPGIDATQRSLLLFRFSP